MPQTLVLKSVCRQGHRIQRPMAACKDEPDDREDRRRRAFRTSPCTYWLQNKCKKGSRCKFAHRDAHGNDWHDVKEEVVSPLDTREVQAAPWKKARMEDGNAMSESHVSNVSTQQSCLAGDHGIFEWVPKQADEEVHRWLHQERLCTPRNARSIERDAIKLKFDDGSIAWRCAYEKLVNAQTGRDLCIEIAGNCDVVWCSMLYGRGERLQKHLANALILGADLRNLVKPALARKECTFANVLFITADALEEYELKAAAWLWSICIVDLPKVNHQRLNHVAHHLVGDNIHPAHVFSRWRPSKWRRQFL